MDAKSIRRMNARLLAEEVGGVTTLAGMAGTSQSYLSQIIGPKPSREVGELLARKLEQATGRPYGWLDESHVTDARRAKARQVYDALLELPDEKIDGIMALLNLAATPAGAHDIGVDRGLKTTAGRRGRPRKGG